MVIVQNQDISLPVSTNLGALVGQDMINRLTKMAARSLNALEARLILFDQSSSAFTQALSDEMSRSSLPFIIKDLDDDGPKSLLGIPLTFNSGKVVGAFCVLDNKSRQWSEEDRKNLFDFAQLVLSEIELKKNSEHQQETLATVAHDLKNPLCGIELATNSSLSMIKNSLTYDPRLLRSFLRIKNCTIRMQSLIKNLLDNYRFESGTLDIKLERHSLACILKSATAPMIPILEEKDVTLEISPSVNDLEFFCDADKMTQAFANLISNAIDFTPPGKKVLISAGREVDLIKISISDEGPGIAPEHIARIFNKFWQKELNSNGHGLGLYIVSKIVKAHSGEVLITNNSHHGATFTVVLPHEIHHEKLEESS